MRLLSWNCRGFGNPCIVLELVLLIKEQALSILFLSETRLDSVGMEWLRVKTKCVGAFCFPWVVTGGGLAMLWTDRMKMQLNTFSRNHIDAMVLDKDSGKEFRLTGFYGNVEIHRRKESWALLKHLRHSSSSSWLCVGDFNEALDSSEVQGQHDCPLWQIQDFKDAMAYIELHDLGFVGHSFTWRNKRDQSGFVTARLD